ncbi:MAG TPA: type II toxin-antitoxin system HicA family toxin [Caldilinea sp.]|nr:type II toxin-antitoxin system HicA family toxin [Caldilinea sp.]
MLAFNQMNSAQRGTLEAIFANPTPSNLAWRQIEGLFVALGAQIIEGRGSRVRFELNGVIASFHRPHPHKEAKPYQVRDAREFLIQAGIRP